MNIQENKELIRRYVKEVWNGHKLEKTRDFINGDLLDEAIEHNQQFLIAFPDVNISIEDLIAEGDKVVSRLVVTGTNSGPFAGRPSTGKKIEFGSFRIYRIAEGKIVETWAMQDRLSLMEQLGDIESASEVNWAAGNED